MNCIRCQEALTVTHYADNPECDAALKSHWGLRSRGKRPSLSRAGGAPPGNSNAAIVTCAKCGASGRKLAMKDHKSACPKRRKRKSLAVSNGDIRSRQ